MRSRPIVAQFSIWPSTARNFWLIPRQGVCKSALKPSGHSPATRLLPTYAQVVINMKAAENSIDSFTIRVCVTFEALIARFNTDCRLVEIAEFQHGDGPSVAEARSREQDTMHQWQVVLQQVSELTTHTDFGALAKIRVLQCCLENGLAADETVVALVRSLARDFDKTIHGDTDRTCHPRASAPPADLPRDG